MAEARGDQSGRSLLPVKCPMCEDFFHDPKLLPCAHRFCRECLITWLASSKSAPSCPICRHQFGKERLRTEKFSGTLPLAEAQPSPSPRQNGANNLPASLIDSVVDELPRDAVVSCLVECSKKLQPPYVCDACQSHEGVADFCLHCNEFLCGGCAIYHRRLTATCKHQLVTLSSLTAQQLASSRKERCDKHVGQWLDLYCPAHGQTLCSQCFASFHPLCKNVETVGAAATRQREVIQRQLSKLNETMVDVKRQQFLFNDGHKTSINELNTLMARLRQAIEGREQQLQQQIHKVADPTPLADNLRERDVDLQEWSTLAAANKALISDMLCAASDVNVLRVSGSLAARAARLSADVSEALTECADLRPVMKVDQNDVLRVEKIVQQLGEVKVVAPAKKPITLADFIRASEGRINSKDVEFDPIRCSLDHSESFDISDVEIEGNNIMCKVNKSTIALTENVTKSIHLLQTHKPHACIVLPPFHCEIRKIAYLQDNLIAVTTNTRFIMLVDFTKTPPAHVKKVAVSKLYTAVAPGLQGSIVLSVDDKPGILDVLTQDGVLLETIKLDRVFSPTSLFRTGDDLLVAGPESRDILKISLTMRGPSTCISSPVLPGSLFVDHLHNLYVIEHPFCSSNSSSSSCDVWVFNTEGERCKRHIPHCGAIVVTEDGFAFTGHGCGGPRAVEKWDLTMSSG